MKKIFKITLWLLIIIIVLVLIYFGLKREKTFSFSFGPGFSFSDNLFNNLSKTRNYFSDFSSATLKDNLNKGERVVNSFTGYFKKEKEIIADKTSELKSEITDSLEKLKEKTAATALEKASGLLEANSDLIINKDLLIKSLAYLTKVNTPLSFVVTNPFNQEETEQKEINYQLDWGDGKKNNGSLKGEESVTISHSWSKEGEYLIRFKISAGSKNFGYQIKILVVK